MIDQDGYRLNVGIILAHPTGTVLWARRRGENAWQFPQGGVRSGENPDDALFRELYEELGVESNQVAILAHTAGWLRYQLPKSLIRQRGKHTCIGQKQRWYLLALTDLMMTPKFDVADHPEFDAHQWVSYWYPLSQVIPFKRDVYRRALTELSPALRWFGPLAC
ncbi:MAG: RNA pyrophosphohydrolase [Gammaproteobacteria bacterium]|nr:RNA pyrophosphohydrolase [Gammaproteobacteria bacterium]